MDGPPHLPTFASRLRLDHTCKCGPRLRQLVAGTRTRAQFRLLNVLLLLSHRFSDSARSLHTRCGSSAGGTCIAGPHAAPFRTDFFQCATPRSLDRHAKELLVRVQQEQPQVLQPISFCSQIHRLKAGGGTRCEIVAKHSSRARPQCKQPAHQAERTASEGALRKAVRGMKKSIGTRSEARSGLHTSPDDSAQPLPPELDPVSRAEHVTEMLTTEE